MRGFFVIFQNDEANELQTTVQRLDEQRYKVVHRGSMDLYVTEINKEVTHYDDLESSLGKISIENFLYIQFILRWEGMGNVQVNHTPTRYDAENSPVQNSYSYFEVANGDSYIRAMVGYRWIEHLYTFNIYDIKGFELSDLHLISITWCSSKYLYS